MSYTRRVHEFSRVCNEQLPKSPVQMTTKEIQFIKKMVNDELDELESAETITEQADALVDAIYYICDCAVKHGMNLDPLFEIVHSANMRKIVDGKVIRRNDGKILKPNNWVDPQSALEAEILRQSTNGSFASK